MQFKRCRSNRSCGRSADQTYHAGEMHIKRILHVYQVDQTIIIILNDKNSSKENYMSK